MILLRPIISFVTSLYSLLVVLLFITVADQPLRRMGYLPLSPTTCALALLAPYALWSLTLDSATRRAHLFFDILKGNILPITALCGVGLTSLLFSILPEAYWQEDGKWIFLNMYALFILVLSLFIPNDKKFKARFPSIAGIALLLLLWSIVTDMNHPGTFAEIDARAAGFPGNANYAALVAVMICSTALRYQGDGGGWRNGFLLSVTGAIVVTSMSRSGLIHFALLIVIFIYSRLAGSGWRLKEALRLATVAGIITTVCASVAITASLSSDSSRQSRLYRLLNNQQVDDGSAASRLFAVKESLRLINEAPILGHGTGHARTMRELPHNLYLQQWVNNGILGLASLAFFFGAALVTFSRRRYRPGQALVAVAIAGGVFSHNILDQRCFLILLGTQLALSYQAARPAIARYASAAARAP